MSGPVSERVAAGVASDEEVAVHWPQKLTPALSDILGMMCFHFISLAQCARAAGHEIPKSAEAEQAFWLHRLLGHWATHGDDWRKAAGQDLQDMRLRAIEASK